MGLIEAVPAKPRTALAAWTVGLDFCQDFFIIKGAASFDASHTVASLAFPLQVTQSMAGIQLPDDV